MTELSSTGFIGSGEIDSVIVNNSGHGLIVGRNNNTQTYAALISSTGVAIPLNVTSSGSGALLSFAINNLFMNNLLVQIPTGGVSGNSAIFANYINTYAQENAFYFVPAVFDGTLQEALVSTLQLLWAACLGYLSSDVRPMVELGDYLNQAGVFNPFPI